MQQHPASTLQATNVPNPLQAHSMGADAVASRVTEAMKDAHDKSSRVRLGPAVLACEYLLRRLYPAYTVLVYIGHISSDPCACTHLQAMKERMRGLASSLGLPGQ